MKALASSRILSIDECGESMRERRLYSTPGTGALGVAPMLKTCVIEFWEMDEDEDAQDRGPTKMNGANTKVPAPSLPVTFLTRL